MEKLDGQSEREALDWLRIFLKPGDADLLQFGESNLNLLLDKLVQNLDENIRSPYFRTLCGRIIWKICQFQPNLVIKDGKISQIIIKLRENSIPFISDQILPVIYGFCTENGSQNIEFVLNLTRILAKTCCCVSERDPYLHIFSLNAALSLLYRLLSKEKVKMEISNLNFVRQAIHCHWDSRFQSVIDLSTEIMDTLLSIIDLSGDHCVFDWLKYYMEKVPWFIKGKYRILPLVIKRCSVEQIHSISNLLSEQLSLCQCKQHTATATAQSVMAWLKKVGTENTSIVNMVVHCLTSKCSLQRLTTSRCWLPVLNKIGMKEFVCDIFSSLLSLQTDNTVCWPLTEGERTMLSCIQTAKALTETDTEDSSDEGWSGNERKLWAIVTLLRHWCINNKIWTLNGHFLVKFVEKCLNERQNEIRLETFQIVVLLLTKHSDFKCEIINSLRMAEFVIENIAVDDTSFRNKLIKGLNDWLQFVASKKHNTNEENTIKYLFINSCPNLFPLANYQRVVTSLLVIKHVLQADTKSNFLSNYRKDKSVCRLILFQLQNASSSDIRKISLDILLNFLNWQQIENVNDDLRQLVYNLCNSPKELNCETAVDLLQLLMKSNSIDQRTEINHFICEAQNSFSLIKENIIDASNSSPLHGQLKAITVLLGYKNAINIDILNSIVYLCIHIIQYTLNAIGSHSKEECPTFAEMCENLRLLSCDHQSDHFQSQHYQLILALCWLNLKDCANLLTKVASCLLEEKYAHLWKEICTGFVDILTRIRHKGALDHCSGSFNQFCKLCKSFDNDQNIQRIPENVLKDILSLLVDHSTVSIRDIGYCSIIEAVLLAQTDTNQHHLLSKCILTLISSTISSPESQHVRVFKCLSSFVSNSALANCVLPYLNESFRLAIDKFSSFDWQVRSASSELISSIYWRVFGKREVRINESNLSNAVSLSEFCSLFSPLWNTFTFIINQIVIKRKFMDCKLYPIISFIQNILLIHSQFMDQNIMSSLIQLRSDLELLQSKTPDYRLRHSAISCLNNLSINVLPLSVMKKETSIINVTDELMFCYENANCNTPYESLLLPAFSGKFGASAQCLALPFVTKNCMTSNNCELFEEWLSMIDNMTKDELMETRRLSAAHSLVIYYQTIQKNLSTKQRIKLFICVCKLLQDESCRVRLVGCKILKSGNSQICLKHLIMSFIKDSELTDEFVRLALSQFKLNFELIEPSSNNRFLFEESDFNVYNEDGLLYYYYHLALCSFTQNQLDEIKKIIEIDEVFIKNAITTCQQIYIKFSKTIQKPGDLLRLRFARLWYYAQFMNRLYSDHVLIGKFYNLCCQLLPFILPNYAIT